MRHSVWFQVLAGVALLLALPACSQTYSYIPNAPGSTAPAPGASAPPPQAETPVEKRVESKDQVQALEARMRDLEGRISQLESYMAAPPPAKSRPAPTGAVKPAAPAPASAEKLFAEGERLYRQKKYQEAAVEFHKVVTQHPKSSHAPGAMLREAYSYKQLHQTQNYQSTLKRLVQAYPKSSEAKKAQEHLKEGSQ